LTKAFVPLFALLGAACFECENTVRDRATAPEAQVEAVLYTRACGATTGDATHITIVRKPGVEPVGIGNVLVLKDPVASVEPLGSTRMRWLSRDTLEVSTLAGRGIQSRAAEAMGVHLVFTTHSDSALPR
jgi:hypothetical protein